MHDPSFLWTMNNLDIIRNLDTVRRGMWLIESIAIFHERKISVEIMYCELYVVSGLLAFKTKCMPNCIF